jgi:hypothetical protein
MSTPSPDIDSASIPGMERPTATYAAASSVELAGTGMRVLATDGTAARLVVWKPGTTLSAVTLLCCMRASTLAEVCSLWRPVSSMVLVVKRVAPTRGLSLP